MELVGGTMKYFMPCDCSCSALVVSPHDDFDEWLTVSMWLNGHPHYSWRNRLRHIWHIIKNGHPYTDAVLLDAPNVKALKSACDDWLNREEETCS